MSLLQFSFFYFFSSIRHMMNACNKNGNCLPCQEIPRIVARLRLYRFYVKRLAHVIVFQ